MAECEKRCFIMGISYNKRLLNAKIHRKMVFKILTITFNIVFLSYYFILRIIILKGMFKYRYLNIKSIIFLWIKISHVFLVWIHLLKEDIFQTLVSRQITLCSGSNKNDLDRICCRDEFDIPSAVWDRFTGRRSQLNIYVSW